MNFEIIDNVIQVTVFFLLMITDLGCWFLRKNRLYIILALAHSCFMMGTLYFVLYLAIRGDVPQFFYVAEISWISSYLFLHSYQIIRYKKQRMRFSIMPLFCSIVIAAIAMRSEIFGPAILSTGAFVLAASAIVYVSVFQILYGNEPHKTSICLLLCVILQVSLYVSSFFIHDYTKFNLYFGIDITLTIFHALVLLCTLLEVKKDDVY